MDGLSLYDTILHDTEIKRSYLHGEHSFHSGFSNHYIVTPTDKYIWYSETGREQYFHLANDPNETHDALHDVQYQQRIEQLRKYLIAELKDREEGYSDGSRLFSGKCAKTILQQKY